MKLFKNLPIILLVVACTVVSIACSNGKSPVGISTDGISGISSDLPESSIIPPENRAVIAVYDATIDPDAGTFTITPGVREGAYHLPLSNYFQNVLQIVGYGFTPNFWADIKLTHPYPGSGIDGFDPRVIAILPANPGVSFNYPTLGVNGNNSIIIEPDGYTKFFDSLGGSIPGNTNPFKAYYKDQPYRCWSSTGATQETQRWQMDITGFGGPLAFKLVLDVSTKYPNPSTPVVDNAPEPVRIKAFIGHGLTPDGGSADITVNLLDWQWQSTIGGVLIEAPDLFTGTISLSYSAPGPNSNEFVYKGIITNSLLAPDGEYKMLVSTWDQATGINMYNEFTVNVSYNIFDGNLIWAKRAGGGASEDIGYGITTLSDNSTVVTGRFEGSATFGPGEINQTVLNSAGGGDIFIAWYNPDGTLRWVKRAGGGTIYWDCGFGITTLSDNSVVVTGTFWGSATFGLGEPNETVLTSAEQRDFFIARYNPDGTLAWAKRAGGSLKEIGLAITTLSDNSTVVTGWFEGASTFGLGEPNQKVLTSAGNHDIFIARYNSDGTLAWAKRAGGTNNDEGHEITTLSDNSTVITGYFTDSATFGPGEINQTVLNSSGHEDIFIAKYNPDGILTWVKLAGGSSPDYGNGITSLSDNSIVVTGYFQGSATFGLDEINQTVLWATGGYLDSDIFVARYNQDGLLTWVKLAGGSSPDYGSGVSTLSGDSIILTGLFYNSATFGLSEINETVLYSVGDYDIFIARYNPEGILTWVKGAGGVYADGGGRITTLSDNSTVVTGLFVSSATFGPSEPNETVLNSAGGYDIFIARFEP